MQLPFPVPAAKGSRVHRSRVASDDDVAHGRGLKAGMAGWSVWMGSLVSKIWRENDESIQQAMFNKP